MEYKWSNDDYGSGSYRSSVFHDKDGSVGGVPDSFIVINGGIPLVDGCEVKPTWNAAVCKGDVGRMNIGGGGGGGRGGGGGGGRGGAPGAAPAGAGGRGGAPGAASRCCCWRPWWSLAHPAHKLLPLAAAGRGGAPGAAPAGAGGRGGGVGARIGRIGEPAQPLAVLSFNGKDFPVTGATNVRAGTEFKVTTERPNVNLSACRNWMPVRG